MVWHSGALLGTDREIMIQKKGSLDMQRCATGFMTSLNVRKEPSNAGGCQLPWLGALRRRNVPDSRLGIAGRSSEQPSPKCCSSAASKWLHNFLVGGPPTRETHREVASSLRRSIASWFWGGRSKADSVGLREQVENGLRVRLSGA
jgi:hypothetical protein